MLEELNKAIRQFKLTYGILLDGVQIYVHPSTFHKFQRTLMRFIPIWRRIPTYIQMWIYKLKKKPVSIDINYLPLKISTVVKPNEIILVRKPEEVLKYEIGK